MGHTVNYWSSKNVEKLESNLNVKDASFSKNSVIIDVHGIMINFLTDIENKGEISYIFKWSLQMKKRNDGQVSLAAESDEDIYKALKALCMKKR